MQERIIDLRKQNEDLKEMNRELKADLESKKLEIEEKNKEVALVKQAALQRIRQLKDEKKKLKNAGASVQVGAVGSEMSRTSTVPANALVTRSKLDVVSYATISAADSSNTAAPPT